MSYQELLLTLAKDARGRKSRGNSLALCEGLAQGSCEIPNSAGFSSSDLPITSYDAGDAEWCGLGGRPQNFSPLNEAIFRAYSQRSFRERPASPS